MSQTDVKQNETVYSFHSIGFILFNLAQPLMMINFESTLIVNKHILKDEP